MITKKECTSNMIRSKSTTLFSLIAVLVAICAYLFAQPPWSLPEKRKVDVYSKDRWFAPGEKDEAVITNESIVPYKIEISKEHVEGMYAKLRSARLINKSILSEEEKEEDWSYGVPFSVAQKVISYYAQEFDWKKQQEMINTEFPQFITKIAGLDSHFVHVKAKEGLPALMLIHGWPGSFLEFRNIIPLLSPHFELIIPSLPGFGPSQAACRPGMDTEETAISFIELMARLDHKEFFLQGGDWGSVVAQKMASLAPERTLGLHLNFYPGFIPLPWGPFQLALARVSSSLVPFDDHDLAMVLKYSETISAAFAELGYYYQQSTRPDTLGYGLSDSPSGWAMWVFEKFYAWTDVSSFEELLQRFDLDQLLTNLSLYYLTGTITTAARYYKEFMIYNIRTQSEDFRRPLSPSVPVGLSDFPGEIAKNQPIAWAKLRFPGLVSVKHHSKGGHFAAMEQSEALASDIIAFVQAVQASKVYHHHRALPEGHERGK